MGEVQFLKLRTNWDSVRNEVRRFTWSAIRDHVIHYAFNCAIGDVIGRLVPTTVQCSKSVDKQWFDL